MQNRKLTLRYPLPYLNTYLWSFAIPKQVARVFSRTHIALLSLILFGIVTFAGINTQYQLGILFKFSFGNIALLAVSALYIITVSQYFLIRDTAFWYYSLYLVLNICYFHYTVFVAEHLLLNLPSYIHSSVGIMLMGGYYLYVKFAIHFLNVDKEYPSFGKRLHFYAFLYALLIVVDLSLMLFFHDKQKLQMGRMVVIFCCIPIGLVSICECFLLLRGRLARIFLAGSTFYFVGSVLGYMFSCHLLTNPFTNLAMANWTFFTETGTVIEAVFFSTGLAYRMRLIEIEKKQIEQELLLKKYEELAIEHALLKQRERISHDLHDDVGATLNSIGVFSEIALQQIRQNNAQSVPLLERIGEASRHLIDVMNDIVWVVNPENDRFENITVRMRLFAADLLMPRNINIHFVADERLNAVNLSIEQRKHFYLIFKEAVNNVCKYAHCDKLRIHIELCATDICMVITDNGQGFDTKHPKNGNGLKSMQHRAVILRGRLSIESHPQKGTQVSLRFPFKEETGIPTELPTRVGQKDKKEAIFVAL